jgi:hypothetical protein
VIPLTSAYVLRTASDRPRTKLVMLLQCRPIIPYFYGGNCPQCDWREANSAARALRNSRGASSERLFNSQRMRSTIADNIPATFSGKFSLLWLKYITITFLALLRLPCLNAIPAFSLGRSLPVFAAHKSPPASLFIISKEGAFTVLGFPTPRSNSAVKIGSVGLSNGH